MRWPTHHVFGLGAAVFFQLKPLGLALAFMGAVLPDLVDQFLASFGPSATRKKRFAAIHRGLSHWPGIWLLPFLAEKYCPPWFFESLCALVLGALTHLLLDALTPKGIPLLPIFSHPRLALPLCRTGSVQELIFFLLSLFGLVFLIWRQLPDYLSYSF